MVSTYFKATQDTLFLKNSVPYLIKEYNFWMQQGEQGHAVFLNNVTLNRYNANTTLPRPESFREDVATAAGLSPSQQARVYHQLASGAETGWDYSSRWLGNSSNLSSIYTSDIIPVDLNVVFFRLEQLLADFCLIGIHFV